MLRIDPRRDLELQCWPALQCLGEGLELAGARLGDASPACVELEPGKLFAAAEHRTEQCERRGNRLAEQIHDCPEHQAADAELRIVEGAADRQVEVDLAATVLEQRDR